MLQKVEFEDDFQAPQEDRSHLLRPSFYWELFKRRWAYFAASVRYDRWQRAPRQHCCGRRPISPKDKILVQSQQIPSELVRPTVTSAAQERIQVIQQRTMTRDNLIAIADKFKLFPDKRALMSVTELVEADQEEHEDSAGRPSTGFQAAVARRDGKSHDRFLGRIRIRQCCGGCTRSPTN